MRELLIVTTIGVLLAPLAGGAFTLQTPASEGCHERITLSALAQAGWPGGAVAPAPTPDDQALLDAVLFSGATDLWEVALAMGARDPDIGSAAITDLGDLAAIHNGADRQADHCLRAPEDDGPLGDALALDRCRAFILNELALAHGASDRIDPTEHVAVTVALKFQTAEILVSRYAFHMGRALHAVQDAFSHAYRTDDAHQVVAVLNYVDPAIAPSYLPERDGPPHESELDHCSSELGQPRALVAETVSAELLGAFARYETKEARFAAARAVLDEWLTYSPGCDEANDWCGQAVERTGCAAAGGHPLAALAVVAALALLRIVRRRSAIPLAFAAVLLIGTQAAAADGAPSRWAVRASAGLAVDKGGAAFAVGGELRLSPVVRLGADVEINPWFDLPSLTAAPGAASAYGSAKFVWATPSGGWEIHSELRLGTSVLLFDLPGAPAGAVGVYFGLTPMRIVLPVADRVALELSPDLAIPVPSLGGVPLAYRQYRLTVGVRWDL